MCVSLSLSFSLFSNFGVIAICCSTGPIYPRDLLPFKTVPKTSRRGLRSFLAFSTAKFYDSKFRPLFVKERIRAGYEKGSRAKEGRPLSRNARSYYFTWTLAHEAHTLKLYEAVRAFGISFQHFSFVDLRRLGLHPNRISWPRRFSISSSISIFLGKCVSNLCLLDFDEIFLYTSNSLLYRSKILEIF